MTKILDLLNLRQEVTLGELKAMMERGEGPFYCLTTIKAEPGSKASLITGLSTILTESRIDKLIHEHGWINTPNKTIAVTINPEAIDKGKVQELTIRDYADLFHLYIERYLSSNRTGSELRNLSILVSRLFATHLHDNELKSFAIGTDDLRPVETYFDHLANSALLSLSVFVVANKKRLAWRSTGRYDTNKPITYVMNELLDNARTDVPQAKIPSLVKSFFYGTAFHDASMTELCTPRKDASLAFAEEQNDPDVAGHGLKSWNMVEKSFSNKDSTMSLIKNHHANPENAGKSRSIFPSVLRVIDYYDEFSATYPVLYRLSRLREANRFNPEAVEALLHIIEPFKVGEVVPVFAGVEGRCVQIGMGEIMELSSNIAPMVKFTAVTNKGLEEFKGQTKLINPFGQTPLYI